MWYQVVTPWQNTSMATIQSFLYQIASKLKPPDAMIPFSRRGTSERGIGVGSTVGERRTAWHQQFLIFWFFLDILASMHMTYILAMDFLQFYMGGWAKNQHATRNLQKSAKTRFLTAAATPQAPIIRSPIKRRQGVWMPGDTGQVLGVFLSTGLPRWGHRSGEGGGSVTSVPYMLPFDTYFPLTPAMPIAA